MNAHIRPSEIASYLSDVEEEFSPARLQLYTSELQDLLPNSARADLESAYQQLQLAQESIRKAANRLGFGKYLDGLRL